MAEMHVGEEAFFLASGCLLLGMVRHLASTNRLSSEDMAEIASMAEETLALIDPTIMSAPARQSALQHLDLILQSATQGVA